MASNENEQTEGRRLLVYQRIADLFPDVFNQRYTNDTEPAFRIVRKKPADGIDFIAPQELEALETGIGNIDFSHFGPDAPEDVQKRMIGRFGLSHNI